MQAPSVLVDLSRAAAVLDVDRRLGALPAWASVRGAFFSHLDEEMTRRGLPWIEPWKRLLGEQPRSYRLYPARHLLSAYARAAALIDVDPHEGLRRIFASIAPSVSQTWYGRTLSKALRPDPAAAMRFIEKTREYVANYAQWRIEARGHERLLFHMKDEYFWIESAQRGGCEGLLAACGVAGEVTAQLDGPFSGHLDIRWERT